MNLSKVTLLAPALLFFLLSGCALFQHGDDPNYTLCKNIEGKIQFGSQTSYTPTAEKIDVEKRRLQATYEKLDCSKFQWVTF
jgi:hypothetical protein